MDVRDFASRKLAALRCHRTQIGPDHAFSAVPEDVFREHLGWERFLAVGRGGDRGWLEQALPVVHA